MNAAREIHHEPEFYLPVAQRSTTLRNELDVIAPAMSDAERRRVDARYALVMAFDVLLDNDVGAARIKRTDESIAANMDLIRDTAAEYLSKTGPTPILSNVCANTARMVAANLKVARRRPVRRRLRRGCFANGRRR